MNAEENARDCIIEIDSCAFCGKRPTFGFPYDGNVNWAHLCNPGNPNGERWMKESVNLETFEAALADWEAFNQETRRLTNRPVRKTRYCA